jgi:hypothetical protein
VVVFARHFLSGEAVTIMNVFQRISLSLVLVSLISCSNGVPNQNIRAAGASSDSGNSNISFGDGKDFYHIISNHTYDFSGMPSIMVSQTETCKYGPANTELPTLHADFYSVKDGLSRQALWHLDAEANKGKFTRNVYETLRMGCCSHRDVRTWYNVSTGTVIAEFTSDDLFTFTTVMPPHAERFLAYKCEDAALKTHPYEQDKSYIASISYSSADSCLQKIIFCATSQASHKFVMGDAWKWIIHDSIDQLGDSRFLNVSSRTTQSNKSVSHKFGLGLRFFGESPDTIRIYVQDDSLDYSSVHSKDFEIRRIK